MVLIPRELNWSSQIKLPKSFRGQFKGELNCLKSLIAIASLFPQMGVLVKSQREGSSLT